MSGNPNNVKLGKRRPIATSNTPDWLFPVKPNPNATPTSVTEERAKDKKAKLVADDLLKRRAAGETKRTTIHPQVVSLVEDFLIDHGFSNTIKTFKNELGNRVGKGELSKNIPSLAALFHEWQNMKSNESQSNKEILMSNGKKTSEKKLKKTKSEKEVQSSSNGTNNSDIEMQDAPPVGKKASPSPSDSSSGSSSESSSESDTDDKAKGTTHKTNQARIKTSGSKRKADSSFELDSTAAPKSKIVKKRPNSSVHSESSSDSSSSSEDSSSSSESDNDNDKKARKGTASSESDDTSNSDSSDSDSSGDDSSSSSDSSSNSSSSSGSSSHPSRAKKIPLPDSESDSSDSPDSSDTDSDSGSDSNSNGPDLKNPPQPKSVATKKTTKPSKIIPSAPLPPDPIIKGKKTNQPFSRIPKDIKVDEKLASNAYVPYDYAQKAHEDLIVTRGKGFTKEKNKKKRGSYKGGYIDVEGKKSVKFED